MAAKDALVVSWITFEDTPPTNPPFALLSRARTTGHGSGGAGGPGGSAGADAAPHPRKRLGATHAYTTEGGRTFYMHFVALRGLEPRAKYSYTVQSGGEGAVPSPVYAFRALPDGTTPTRLDMYGDMGVYEYNSMEWLLKDCNADATASAADAIVHMGDHAYAIWKRAVILFGWVFFLISSGSPHVRPMGRTCGEPDEIELTAMGVELNGSRQVQRGRRGREARRRVRHPYLASAAGADVHTVSTVSTPPATSPVHTWCTRVTIV